MTDTFLDRDRFRRNHFGAMRLALAIFVIVSHTFAAFGGEVEDHEILMAATGKQMDLGALAVNSFFAISGYLITLSWLRTPKLKTFLAKRALRIYPGFLVASILSLLIVAPLAGARWAIAFTPLEICKSLARLVLLSPPQARGSFDGEPWAVLNLPLWTIRYEFICYLLVPLILLMRGKFLRIGVTALLAILLIWHASQGKYLVTDASLIPIVGSLGIWPKFLAYFVGGMFFAINRDVIPFRHGIAALCLAILIFTGMFGGFFFAMATAGIYLIFYIAYQNNFSFFKLGTKHDLSYGVYLYGWPVQMLLVYYFRPQLGAWQVIAIAIPCTLLLAMLSWFFVESPFLLKKKLLAHASKQSARIPLRLTDAAPIALRQSA